MELVPQANELRSVQAYLVVEMLNEQTFDFSQAKLKLKDGLRFSLRQDGGAINYLVEDEVTARFFRVGLPQYTFLTMLDGRRTVSTALMMTSTLLREHGIDETDSAVLCKWAIESGLIESETGNSAARQLEQHMRLQKQKLTSYMNPMMLRIPLFDPDALVTPITRAVGFLVSPLGAMIWVSMVFYGFFHLASNWDAFVYNRVNSFSATDIAWIGLTWLLLKLVHELAHSVVCKKFGGRTNSCGVLFLLMIPLPYVDVTTSWRFDSKWKRILVAAAGMLSEIFIAAIACCVWVWSDPGPLKYHAGNVIITATLHTLLFNINPLMRFDGYYMLADWLEIPNLATQGRQWLKAFFKWVYFGKKPAELNEQGTRGFVIKAYGVLAMFWFFTIAIGLSLAASGMMEGFGLLVALIGCFFWIGIPVFKLAKYVTVGTETDQPDRKWFSIAMSLTVICLAGFLYFFPSPSVISAPVVIDYEPIAVVRTTSTGFANSIHVTNGQQVKKGDLLVSLVNPDLKQELTSLLVDIKISELRIKSLFSSGRISDVQLEQESLAAMQKKQIELEGQIADLEVLSPQDGQILARDLNSSIGKHFVPGDEVLSVVQPEEIQAIALTNQADIEWIEDKPDIEIELRVWGRHQRQLLKGRIKTIDPRARDDVPHEAFSASIGGPLAVVSRDQVEDSKEADNDLMLVQPRVLIEIELEPEDRKTLVPGQTGELFVRSRDQNIGTYLAENFVRFVRDNNYRTHGF